VPLYTQIKLKQHCMKDRCCDFEEIVSLTRPTISGEINVPIGCLAAELTQKIVKETGFYFGASIFPMSVFEFPSRRYLRQSTPEDVAKWKEIYDKYVKPGTTK
jgi:hypothetical protein